VKGRRWKIRASLGKDRRRPLLTAPTNCLTFTCGPERHSLPPMAECVGQSLSHSKHSVLPLQSLNHFAKISRSSRKTGFEFTRRATLIRAYGNTRMRLYSLHNSIILADAHFSHDNPRNFILDLPFACCPAARESGSAPPNRRASEVRSKTVEIDSSGPPVVDLPVPPVARLALGAGHRQGQKRSLLGIVPAFGCSGPGRRGTANPDDPSFRARSEI
jgi:hypothetical protein